MALLGGHRRQVQAALGSPGLGLRGEKSRQGPALCFHSSQSTEGLHPSRVHFPWGSQLVPAGSEGARPWPVSSLRLRGPGRRVLLGIG